MCRTHAVVINTGWYVKMSKGPSSLCKCGTSSHQQTVAMQRRLMTHTRNKTLNTNVTVPAAPSASAGSVTLVNTFDIC